MWKQKSLYRAWPMRRVLLRRMNDLYDKPDPVGVAILLSVFLLIVYIALAWRIFNGHGVL